MVSIFVATASVSHCWQILVFSSSFALNFINRPFGSLFWLPRVPIGSLFHEKLGPYWVPIFKHEGPYKFGEQCNMHGEHDVLDSPKTLRSMFLTKTSAKNRIVKNWKTSHC